MIQEYRWRGERIRDIHAWCRDRGELMVRFHGERTVPDLRTGGLITEVDDGAMPESFWSGLCSQHGWHYTEVGREVPRP